MGEDMNKDQNNEQQPLKDKDVEDNKIMAVLAYLIFLIPLLAAKDSPFAKYHTNQGCVLFLLAVVINIVGSIIPFIGWFLIIPIGNLLVVILAVIGIINAINGVKKPLPIIGKIDIIK